jgi:membrane fusion protein (multidrug efflux system)
MHVMGRLGCAREITFLLLAVAATGCEQGASEPPFSIPPMVVQVQTVTTTPLDIEVDLIGFIEPQRTAEIRARVDGIVEQLLYKEGSDVEAGTPLFQIDDRDFRAQLAQAEAMLKRTRAVPGRSENACGGNRRQRLPARTYPMGQRRQPGVHLSGRGLGIRS